MHGRWETQGGVGVRLSDGGEGEAVSRTTTLPCRARRRHKGLQVLEGRCLEGFGWESWEGRGVWL